LQQQGWDVIRVSQVLPMGASDDEILEFARREDRVVITQDLDFSALLAQGDNEKRWHRHLCSHCALRGNKARGQGDGQ